MRCEGEAGEPRGACEACESVAREAEAMGYVFMVACSLRDMVEHGWVESEAAAEVRGRIGAVPPLRAQLCSDSTVTS